MQLGFTVSQRDSFASALRVIGKREEEREITKEDSNNRFTRGIEAVTKVDYAGFANMLCCTFMSSSPTEVVTLLNEILGLPKEDLDEATRIAIERQEATQKQ
jgi:hypothetical protein